MATEETEIEKKQNEKKGKTGGKKDDWVGFLYSVIGMLIITIFLGLIGCNFIYFTNLSEVSKNYLFPTSQRAFPQNYNKIFPYFPQFPQDYSQKGGKNCPTKFAQGGISISEDKKKYIPSPSDGFPYNLAIREGGKGLQGILSSLKNWLAFTIADSYSAEYLGSREILVKFLDILKPNGLIPNNESLRFFIGIIFFFTVLTFLPILMFFIWAHTAVRGVLRAFEPPNAILFGLVIFFTCLSCWPATWCAISQPLQFVLTFTLLPLILDTNNLRRIVACNQNILVSIFAGLCVIAGFANLSNIPAITMAVFYIIFLLQKGFATATNIAANS